MQAINIVWILFTALVKQLVLRQVWDIPFRVHVEGTHAVVQTVQVDEWHLRDGKGKKRGDKNCSKHFLTQDFFTFF